ncbi:MAG: autotransporter domain-containing protein [Herbaspirillum huttiense]|uniref:autotransporter outer membrane beta-barrel domain-containing protein n=2 Tax=Herbaspirillum TaxID=963 RepID=UPI001AC8A382|nr:autotransporter outer membrane beta-barrel domain-containing protein [Herbaspirillum huttiense]MBN9355921.1 autotransporter domain-containing protein [Herbaspirillum huttiense]
MARSSLPLRLLPLALALQAIHAPAQAANYTVANGTTDTSAKTLTKNGADNITVNAGGTLASGSAATIRTSQDNDNLSTVTINNAGTIGQNSGLTAISINHKKVNLILNNAAGGVITSSSSSAKTPTILIGKGSDTFSIVNLGTISQTGPTPTNADNGKNYAINANGDYSTAGNTIVNGSASNSSATISSSSSSAIKMGSNILLTNYGRIFTTSPVNTSCPDYLSACASGSPPKAADGISIDDGIRNAVIVNYGSITGARHGIDGGDPVAATPDSNLANAIQLTPRLSATGITFDATYADGSTRSNVAISNNVVINQAGGVITGNNGSGVGFDSHGVVFNYGTIIGNYAGSGRVYDVLGNGATTSNGDGDGVDIDGTAYIENWGTIRGNGAGGLDSTGQPNGADGIAAGGGTIINHAGAVIYGDAHGILIDDGNDWSKDPSNPRITYNTGNTTGRGTGGANGVNGAKAYIVNDGSITGNKGIAIGLVGNYDDTLINNASGVITGGAQATLTGQGGSTVPGAAVQMGGGNDTLINYGRIEGKNGLAIDMGDGDDSLQLLGGTVIGTINGGAGIDTLTTGGTQTFAAGVLSGFENYIVRDGVTRFNYDLGTVNNMTVNQGAVLQVNGAFGTSGNLAINGAFQAAEGTATRTINVGGNLSVGSNGTLQVAVAGPQADRINAAGSATLANGATLQPVVKTYVPNTARWTILSAASGLSVDVSTIQLADTATLDYGLQVSGNDLILTAQRTASVSDVSGSPLGRALDALGNNSSNAQVQNLLASLDALPTAAAYRSAVRQLQPETNRASQQAAQVSMGSVFSAVAGRVDSARGDAPVASQGGSGVATGEAAARGRVWLQGLGAWGRQQARAGADGYDVSAYGMAAGMETDLSAREVAGLTLGYTRAGTRGSDNASGNDVNVDAVHVGGYVGLDMDGWTLDGALMVGGNHYSSQRAISFLGQTVSGSYNGWQVGARVEAGLPFALSQRWSGRWLAGLRLSHLSNEGYTESGNAALAQNVESSRANSVQPTLGVEFNRLSDNGDRLQLRARYLHELAGNPDVTASFVAGGPSFTTASTAPNRDAVQLGVSYRFNGAQGSYGTLGYDAEVRDRSLMHQLTARVGWLF